MRRFVRFIGRLPFSGKIPIRGLVYRIYQGASEQERLINYRRLVRHLMIEILLHAGQATAGAYGLTLSAPNLAKLVFALYLVGNFSVVITHVYLLRRIVRESFAGGNGEGMRLGGAQKLSKKEMRTAIMVTINAQLIFCKIFFTYL